MKTCTTCRAEKLFTEFAQDKARSDGYQSSCKACRNKRAKDKYASDPEFRQAAIERSAKRDIGRVVPDREREDRRLRNEQRRRAAGAVPKDEYFAKVKADAAIRKASARREAESSTPHDAHVKRWRKACGAAWFVHRYRTDAEFNAKQKLRARLRKLAADGELAAYLSNQLKKGSMWKRWEVMMGYTTRQLVAHLKRTLPKRATWDDFLAGRLHIDHILPRSSFDLTDPDEVKRCWSLSNLQLLWAADNLRKSAKVEVLL